MQHVGQRLGMHQAMLDSYMPDLLRSLIPLQCLVHGSTNTAVIALDLSNARPVGGLIFGGTAYRRVDAELEQLVEFRMEGWHPQCTAADLIPVEGLKMAQIKDVAMS